MSGAGRVPGAFAGANHCRGERGRGVVAEVVPVEGLPGVEIEGHVKRSANLASCGSIRFIWRERRLAGGAVAKEPVANGVSQLAVAKHVADHLSVSPVVAVQLYEGLYETLPGIDVEPPLRVGWWMERAVVGAARGQQILCFREMPVDRLSLYAGSACNGADR
jgi:hypothetical protein